MNSSLFYWFFIISSNCRDLTVREIENFPLDPKSISPELARRLRSLCSRLMEDYMTKSKKKETKYKATGKVVYREFYPKLSKKIIDEIDNIVSQHYGFNEKETNYIKTFDIRFRMGE
jgi:hypothetical protein